MMLRSPLRCARRRFASAALEKSELFAAMQEIVPQEQKRIKDIRSAFGKESLGQCTVEQAYAGMRGIPGMVWETSLLDADEGIRFRGLSIPDLQRQLPTARNGAEPLPEGLLYLLLTGRVPTSEQAEALSRELAARAPLGADAEAAIDRLPAHMHPMTQFCSGVLALQPHSKFAAAYADGAHKTTLWQYALDDSLDLIAKLPGVAARIYRNTFKDRAHIAADPALDLSANFARQLGYDSAQFAELMRLYLTIHADHEGGNVSAHASHLVGSALADPYLSFTAAMTGLAGPLHGLANQEVLNWLLAMQKVVGEHPSDEAIEKYCWDQLNAGRVIPGYGHAVLRIVDPRFTAQHEYAKKHMPDDPLFNLVDKVFQIVPRVLTEQGKVKSPYPNVDCASGTLLVHYGMTEQNFYTVLFGVSRAMGVMSQLVWSRALGFPIERPKSVTSEWIANKFQK